MSPGLVLETDGLEGREWLTGVRDEKISLEVGGISKCLNGNLDGGLECGSLVIALLKPGNRDNGVVQIPLSTVEKYTIVRE